MDKLYKEIIKIIDKIGVPANIENQDVKVIDLSEDVLVYEPITGWLGLRQRVQTTALSNQKADIFHNKVLYKSRTFCYCLKNDLEKVISELMRYD